MSGRCPDDGTARAHHGRFAIHPRVSRTSRMVDDDADAPCTASGRAAAIRARAWHRRPSLVAARRHLPDLSALLHGQRRRRRRRPGGHRPAARLPAVARRRRDLDLADLSRRRWPTSATTSPTTRTSIRSSARSRTSTALLAEATRAACKLILDFVPNHTLRPAPVVRRSRARSRDNPKRDWYLWRDPAPDGGPPNNWLSVFGGSGLGVGRRRRASTTTTPSSRSSRTSTGATRRCATAMLDVLRFWLDRGVDGFRVDVHLAPDQGRRVPRQPAQPRLPPGHGRRTSSSLRALHDRPARRCTTSSRGCAALVDELRRAAC